MRRLWRAAQYAALLEAVSALLFGAVFWFGLGMDQQNLGWLGGLAVGVIASYPAVTTACWLSLVQAPSPPQEVRDDAAGD